MLTQGLRRLAFKTSKSIRHQVRYLSIHEHDSQRLLKEFQIPVPHGKLAVTPEGVRDAVSKIGAPCVIKSQVLAGGRGKGTFDNGLQGGIQLVKSAEEGFNISSKMLGHRLNTKQTKEGGLLVNKVYVAEVVDYVDEYYLAMTIDREAYAPTLIISKAGGVDIEKTAAKNPEQLHRFAFTMNGGITPGLVAEIGRALDCTLEGIEKLADILKKMWYLFTERDALLLEVNPLVRTKDGNFICLDAKFRFDDAAEKRQPELFALRDQSERTPEEEEAARHGLVYIQLDGNIGNVVNGAGLAMATNDAIAAYGGKSANFLDAGGQATKDTMLNAFKIILADERVKVILVNIYGGITRCDMIAESILAAAAELGELRVPLVVRLQGTNSEAGLKLIEESDLGLHTESGFGEAAKKAMELAQSGPALQQRALEITSQEL